MRERVRGRKRERESYEDEKKGARKSKFEIISEFHLAWTEKIVIHASSGGRANI